MRSVRRAAVWLFALAASFAAPLGAQPSALPDGAAQKIDALFSVWSAGDRPGCSVGVVERGALIFARGYGMANLEHAVPITLSTVFDIGSVSKQFTAASIALLVIDGKVSLDDDIRRFVPELPEYATPVTVRHLLHHRGGLKDYIDPLIASGADVADVTTSTEALAVIVREREVDFPTGERYEYSNTGYFLLGVIVERASGLPLPRFAEERIFQPLGMRATHFHGVHTELVRNRATGYSMPLGSTRVGIDTSNWEQVGDGSVFTTVEDLARWVANFESGTVGGPRFLELMALPGLPEDESDGAATYGLGQAHGSWRGLRTVRHGGSWAGYRAHLLRLPDERVAVAILCNVAEADTLGEKAERIAEVVLGNRVAAPAVASLLIRNATIVDGTGAKRRRGDLRIVGDRIEALGKLTPRPGETTFDATGKVLAPGFIDTHSHADRGLEEHDDALAAVSQGITTIVVGQDGGDPYIFGGQDGSSIAPLAEFFARLDWSPASVNVASYVGQGTLRAHVMGGGFRRIATAAELAAMAELLDREMAAGALGLSTGLEYDPGIYSSREEVIELARVAARHGGRYISHVRSEDRQFWEAIEEILEIGQAAKIPVQISHIKLAMRSLWGEAPRLLARLDRARAEGIDVSADFYPYLDWHAELTVLFPERDFENLATAQLVLDQIAPPEGLLMDRYLPERAWEGKTVAEIAQLRGETPAATLVELIRRAQPMKPTYGDKVESVIGTSMTEDDLERLLAWKETNLCTDGELDGRHPRGFGAYPRVLGRYVRERKLLPLEEAVRKMTSLAADHVGIRDRGRLVPGAYADLVLFDPATVVDRATLSEPQALSAGIDRVWVNGQVVFADGEATWARPGSPLRRPPGAAMRGGP